MAAEYGSILSGKSFLAGFSFPIAKGTESVSNRSVCRNNPAHIHRPAEFIGKFFGQVHESAAFGINRAAVAGEVFHRLAYPAVFLQLCGKYFRKAATEINTVDVVSNWRSLIREKSTSSKTLSRRILRLS